uniref:Uncharacterized protein n=1 Tax=Acrobeloides nanus TaxID=290746 RepID=A0A914D6I9_9BILA
MKRSAKENNKKSKRSQTIINNKKLKMKILKVQTTDAACQTLLENINATLPHAPDTIKTSPKVKISSVSEVESNTSSNDHLYIQNLQHAQFKHNLKLLPMVYPEIFRELEARINGVIELSQIVRDLFARNQNSLCSSTDSSPMLKLANKLMREMADEKSNSIERDQFMENVRLVNFANTIAECSQRKKSFRK